MSNTINTRIRNKRDTSSNWTSNNPVILAGELIVVDTNEGKTRLKVGDGTKTYTQLPFIDEEIYNALSNKADKSEVSGGGSISYASADVSTDGTSVIDLPIQIDDTTKMMVYYNGLLLLPNVHYTASTTSITLNGFTAYANDVFTFLGSPTAGSSLEATAGNVTVQDVAGYFGGISTVEGALQYLAQNKGIQSISVNGTQATVENGAASVEIAIEAPKVQSISLNGTNVSIDSNKNAGISGVVTDVKVDGTSNKPDSSGAVSITLPSTMMKRDIAQTMQARLVAQNNTDYTVGQVRNIFLVPKSNSSSLPAGGTGDICIVYKD